MTESENLEFKEKVSDDIYKSAVAFANTNGGTLIVGISNSGEVMPFANIDEEYTRLTNGIRDAIAPDVTMFVKYTLEERGTIRIDVAEGSYKPYYLKSKGLKPSGVYVRHGASSAPASPEQIRQMIKYADGDQYEEMRSITQELTFEECSRVFKENDVPFSEDKYGILGIRSKTQNQYTNLALLLSDQCGHVLKIAVFADTKNTVFRDRKEFTGSVLKQAELGFDYLQLNNKNRSVIDGLSRKDYWDYPKDAVREALLNAIIHRDYSYSGDIIINVNDEFMEFISIGGLLPGLSTEDIRNGISQLRNRGLANVFHRLNFIEAYGTGIRRIFAHYEDLDTKPEIVVTPNSFRLVLPNRNTGSNEHKPNLSSQVNNIIDYLTEHGEATDENLQKLLNVKRTRTYTLTKQMVDSGLLKIIGRGSNKKYVMSREEGESK